MGYFLLLELSLFGGGEAHKTQVAHGTLEGQEVQGSQDHKQPPSGDKPECGTKEDQRSWHLPLPIQFLKP